MNKQKRTFCFDKDKITKLQLMKAMETNKSITYSKLVQDALDLLWETRYKNKLSEV